MKISRLFILTVITFVAILALASCGECKHKNTDWETITESTCTSKGVRQKECEDCEAILETEKLEKSAHIPSESVPKKDVVCTVCGYIIEPAAGISFSTLSVDGTNVYGKVPSSTESFSFINEVNISGKAKFLVSLDKYGTHTVATKILPLTPGDNTIYVIEMIGDEVIETYTVTIRRLPIYTVSFDTVGGSPVSSQTVEEGSLAEMPAAPTREGYTFTGWSHDFSNPITADTTVTASWDVHTNTGYKVEYYLENANDDGYTLTQTESHSGITDTIATAERKTFEHFYLNTSKSVLSGNISGDGSLVLKVYYRRNMYSLTNANSGYGSITTTGSYKYGGAILTVTATVEKLGYEFLGWYSGDELVSSETTYVFTADRNIESRFAPRADMANFIFSSTDTTCEITGIRDNTVTSIVIPDSVTSIGYGAFRNCTSLTSVEIGDSVTSIGRSAFEGCTSLTSIEIPDSVTSIGSSAFSGCTSLTSVVIGEGVTSIGDYAFENCKNIINLVYNKEQMRLLFGMQSADPSAATSVYGGADTIIYYSGNAFNLGIGGLTCALSAPRNEYDYAGLWHVDDPYNEGEYAYRITSATSIYLGETANDWKLSMNPTKVSGFGEIIDSCAVIDITVGRYGEDFVRTGDITLRSELSGSPRLRIGYFEEDGTFRMYTATDGSTTTTLDVAVAATGYTRYVFVVDFEAETVTAYAAADADGELVLQMQTSAPKIDTALAAKGAWVNWVGNMGRVEFLYAAQSLTDEEKELKADLDGDGVRESAMVVDGYVNKQAVKAVQTELHSFLIKSYSTYVGNPFK